MSRNDFGGRFWGSDVMMLFRNLRVLDLGDTAIYGELPHFGLLPNLQVLRLENNRLFGSVQGELLQGGVPLVELDLSGNKFSVVPFRKSTQQLSNNLFMGGLLSSIGNLGRLKWLNLACNNLSGHLPFELNKLIGLVYLNLSHNSFIGEIPDQLPSGLKFFDAAYNKLSGKIPENLYSFPDSSFSGNNLETHRSITSGNHVPGQIQESKNHHRSSKSSIRVAIVLASIGASVMIVFVVFAYRRARFHDYSVREGFCGQTAERDIKVGKFSGPSLLDYSEDHLLISNSRSLSGQLDSVDAGEGSINQDNCQMSSGRKSSPDSQTASSSRLYVRQIDLWASFSFLIHR
ncbi:hypothetical protein OROHE_024274 [Orobanche hederae]